jgi:hypothetical protein
MRPFGNRVTTIPRKENDAVTSYPQAPAGYGQQAPVAVSRPATLVAAVGAAVLGALLAVVDGALIISGSKDIATSLAGEVLADEAGMTLDQARELGGGLMDAAIGEATDTLNARAYLIIGLGVFLLLFGLLMLRKAATWARVLLTLTALPALGNGIRIATDEGTGAMMIVAWAVAIVALLTIVLTWLPANHRYAKARKGN